MLIIPEIETVLILVPRTGSGSLKRAVMARYPDAFMPYRHMEADGVPAGYDRWQRIGVCRHPVERLWSLYKFLRSGGSSTSETRRRRLMPTVQRGFQGWLINNDAVFATGHDDKFRPIFHSLHEITENRKSQFVYLRPDLGTIVYEFNQLDRLAYRLGVDLPHVNVTDGERAPYLFHEQFNYVQRMFAWEIETFDYCLYKAA